jgi:hypothetical protein
MRRTWANLLVVVACVGNAGLGAQAQTARIAHLSHGGSLATLAAEAEATDNFGLPPARFFVDTIVATSDTTAVVHGRLSRWKTTEGSRSTRTISYGKPAYQQFAATGPQSRGTAVRLLQQRYPGAKLVGFDTLAKPTPAPALPAGKQRKRKRTESALLDVGSPAPPQHPGVWLALAAIVALGAAGALLSDKPRPVSAKIA